MFLGGSLTPGVGKGNSYRTFLVPKSDFRIERNWDVIGLRGTGSHDIGGRSFLWYPKSPLESCS